MEPIGVEAAQRRLPELLERVAALVAFLCNAKGTGKYLGPLLQGIAQGQAAVMVTDNPHLAQTDHLPVPSALRP
jgi:hypothetical protein